MLAINGLKTLPAKWPLEVNDAGESEQTTAEKKSVGSIRSSHIENHRLIERQKYAGSNALYAIWIYKNRINIF